MKRTNRFLQATFCLTFLVVVSSRAAVLFSEDFESGLSHWRGKTNAVHHGITVPDPITSGRGMVLTFTEVNGWGDIFTTNAFFPTNALAISFDYLGLRKAGSGTRDLGGYLGISDGFPGNNGPWLASADGDCSTKLVDDGQWHRYTVLVAGQLKVPFHLMLQDYAASPIPGDAFFDNIKATDWPLLTVFKSSSFEVEVTWPTNAANYALEVIDNLHSSVWTQVTNSPIVASDLFFVRLPVQPTPEFFRLHRR